LIYHEKFSTIYHDIIASVGQNKSDIFLILIGGFSRSGKTTFANQLNKELRNSGYNSTVIGIDSWLLDIIDRPKDSIITQRYDCKDIESSVINLLNGKSIYPPNYDASSRKRIKNIMSQPVSISEGIIIWEGTIALSIKELLRQSNLNIFININDYTRLKRIIKFYRDEKKVPREEYKNIIKERETEEIPYIRNSMVNAHYIFNTKTN